MSCESTPLVRTHLRYPSHFVPLLRTEQLGGFTPRRVLGPDIVESHAALGTLRSDDLEKARLRNLVLRRRGESPAQQTREGGELLDSADDDDDGEWSRSEPLPLPLPVLTDVLLMVDTLPTLGMPPCEGDVCRCRLDYCESCSGESNRI